MSPDLLQQCFGEPPDTLEMLVLTSEPVDQVRQWLNQAYPLCTGEPEILGVTETDDLTILENRRWPLVCLLLSKDTDVIGKSALSRMLARLRDLHADRVIHIESSQSKSRQTGKESRRAGDLTANNRKWTLADSLALGYTQRGMVFDGSRELRIFEFDIRTYKPAPDWLNSKHWANPEQWGKRHW